MASLRQFSGAFLGCVSFVAFSGVVQADWTLSFSNQTNLSPSSYIICAQGTDVLTTGGGQLSALYALNSAGGNSYAFTQVTQLTGLSNPLVYPPAFQVSPSTSISVSPALQPGGQRVEGARVYYYIQPLSQGSTCQPELYYSTVQTGTNPNVYAINGVAYPSTSQTPMQPTVNGNPVNPFAFVEFSASGTSSSATLDADVSNVDSFTLPTNIAINTPEQFPASGNIPAYAFSLVGNRVTGAQGLSMQEIVQNFQGQFPAPSPYAGLLSSWPGSGFPQYIASPYDFLKLSVTGSTTVQWPNVASPLNTIFDAELNALFGRTILITKGVGLPHYRGEPVNSAYPPTTGGFTAGNFQALGFCVKDASNFSSSCGGSYSYYVFNPIGLAVVNFTGSGGALSPILGSQSQGGSTITFTPSLPAGILSAGMYVKAVAGNLSSGSCQIQSLTSSGGFIQSASFNATGSCYFDVALSGAQYLFSKVPPASGTGQFQSSGTQVFGNSGVFTGDFPGSNADIGIVLAAALNRGATNVVCSGSCTPTLDWDSNSWGQASSWYPQPSANVTGGNLYSWFMHTMTASDGLPFMALPNAKSSAQSAVGSLMAMAYGFGYDETNIGGTPNYQVPSEFNAITQGNQITVALGPVLSTSTSTFPLVVNRAGTGAADGQVVSTLITPPNGVPINCVGVVPADCSGIYDSGTVVKLHAQSSTATFTGWSLASCPGTADCSVTLNQAQTVTANFTSAVSTFPLHVSVSGSGSVTSSPSGINCGSGGTACVVAEGVGALVTLTATSANFLGWTGACSGTNPTCQVTMSQAQSVSAAFGSASQFQLSVTPSSGGVIYSHPDGIYCGAQCLSSFASGTSISLFVNPQSGFQFSSWGGACAGQGIPCQLTMSANQSVSANFTAVPSGSYPLTVTVVGSGSVASSPGGISCGASCSANYSSGAQVVLTAAPVLGYQFAGWYGPCSGVGGCNVTMDEAQFVTAKFTLSPTPAPAPIPTLSEWAQILMMFMMILSVGYYSWRQQRRF